MKPRKIGNPYAALRQSRDRLTKRQYEALRGQIKNGKPDDAMRGLARLMERSTTK